MTCFLDSYKQHTLHLLTLNKLRLFSDLWFGFASLLQYQGISTSITHKVCRRLPLRIELRRARRVGCLRFSSISRVFTTQFVLLLLFTGMQVRRDLNNNNKNKNKNNNKKYKVRERLYPLH
jgi:hypothetical protein